MKKRIWAHLPPLSLTLASPGRLWGYPSHENLLKSTENTFQNMETFPKMITPEKIPYETAIRKLTIVASLQCADKTTGRKFTIVASSQRANKPVSENS
jgi:hypothetical protein